MSDLTSQVGISLVNDSDDVLVLTPIPATASTSTNSTERVSSTQENLPKTIREKFYVNIKTYQTKWCGQCTLCNKIQYDSKGVTSNLNRHVKNQHGDAYREWLNQLNDLHDKDQKKISDVFLRSIGSTKTMSSKSFYAKNHPRQIELSESIVQKLILVNHCQ